MGYGLMDLVTILTIKGLTLMRLIPLSVISPLVGSDSEDIRLRVNLLNVIRIPLTLDYHLDPAEVRGPCRGIGLMESNKGLIAP